MSNEINVVAIDGPAASGKSTVAGKVAERLGAIYINTGNMYRAVTLAALQKKIDLDAVEIDRGALSKLLAETSLEYRMGGGKPAELFLDGRRAGAAIRSPGVAKFVSRIAAIPDVRKWLVDKQRKMASENNLVVMEGRDIGTVVFPGARFKFFLTASPEVRARRRLEQEGETPEGATVASVAAEIAERDRMDMGRKVAPLTMADNAELVDSSDMTVEEVVEAIASMVKKK